MDIQVIVVMIQVRPVEIQFNIVQLHLSSVVIHVRLVENMLVLIKFNFNLFNSIKKNVNISNTKLFFHQISTCLSRNTNLFVFPSQY